MKPHLKKNITNIAVLIALICMTGCGSGSGSSAVIDQLIDQLDDASSSSIKVFKVGNPDHTAARGDAVFKIEGREQQILYKSMDGGNTFEVLSTPDDSLKLTTQHSLFITPNNILLWAYAEDDYATGTTIKIFRSTDWGESLSQNTLTIPECFKNTFVSNSAYRDAKEIEINKTSLDHNYENLEVLSCGLYAMNWASGGDNGPLYLFLAFKGDSLQFLKSDDDGINFSEAKKVEGMELQHTPSIPFGAANQNLYFIKEEGLSKSFIKSENGGNSFEEIDIESLIEYFLNIKLVAYNNTLYIVYGKGVTSGTTGYYLIKSTDAGNTFSEPVPIAQFSFGDVYLHLEDIETNGENLYILWSRQPNNDNTGAIYLSMSTDGGETFSSPQRISEYTSYVHTWCSSILDPSGDLFVFWTDDSLISLRY